MSRNLSNVFSITSFFDEARWSTNENDNIINFVPENLTDDNKLLTHWLCYITDRQMGFERIWNIAGFIFSDLVYSICSEKNLSLLNPKNSSKTFFIKLSDFAQNKKNSNDVKDSYLFVGRHKVGDNKKLLDDNQHPNELPVFQSRFYPSDYKSILFTLIILKDFNFSIVEYLLPILTKNLYKKDLIRRLIFSLYLLTYKGIGKSKIDDINFEDWEKKGLERKDDMMKILNDNSKFEEEFNKFAEIEIFNQKRAWCSLRDFFKSKKFNTYFLRSLEEHGFQHLELLKDTKLLRQFELPGDVWNNKPKFRECIVKGSSYEKNCSDSFNKLLREIYTKENISTGYPEQFDITFDFVPLMCMKRNCDLCPYGKDIEKGKNLDKICNKNISKYCSVVLACCGYKQLCNPGKCELVKLEYV
jgi:hypothetical protein